MISRSGQGKRRTSVWRKQKTPSSILERSCVKSSLNRRLGVSVLQSRVVIWKMSVLGSEWSLQTHSYLFLAWVVKPMEVKLLRTCNTFSLNSKMCTCCYNLKKTLVPRACSCKVVHTTLVWWQSQIGQWVQHVWFMRRWFVLWNPLVSRHLLTWVGPLLIELGMWRLKICVELFELILYK